MGNGIIRALLVRYSCLCPCQTRDNYKELDGTNEKTENEDLKQKLVAKEQDLETLNIDYNDLRRRNDELQGLLRAKEYDLDKFRIDNNVLLTRLSEMGAMQLIEGNPNIADLSDHNRPDKIAEQFSELYDNQWTDCYIVLDRLTKSERETVETLLTILKTVYDISLNRSQMIMSDARKALVAFAGISDEESEKALDSLIQETLHKMKYYRTKHFKAVPKDIAKEINVKLVATIGEQEVTACSEYIEACVRICWLMCIKDPPMYIFCEKEDVFNKNHFMEYTEKGHKVSYVVWPALYLYKNGPLMRKGVAQGEGKQIEDNQVLASEDGSCKFNDSVEKKPQFRTLEGGQNHIVLTSIASSEKTQYDNTGKVIDAFMPIHDDELGLGNKPNDIFPLENKTHTVDNARDMDVPHSLTERCEQTEERVVSTSNDEDRPEVNGKEENTRVGDVCSLSENIVAGKNDTEDNKCNVAVATADGVANGDAVMSIYDNELEFGKKTKNIFPFENEIRAVDKARDMDAPHSLTERCEETEERIVSPSNDKDIPEVNVKEENTIVGDVCSLSENIVPGKNDAEDYACNVAFTTADDVANGDAVMSINDNEMELGKKTNDIFPFENKTRTVDNASNMDASHSLDDSCEETNDHFVFPSNDTDRSEVNVKEDSLRVGDVCSLSGNIVPGENETDNYNRNVAVATADGAAIPTVELQKEKHHQRKLSEDSSDEGH
ncbi:hypothetical protein ACJMK2_031995 [Sinanodonta woodiana]|uniref:Mitochondria-eating protein n=1 Tax=Sinanodonta woodiana TaxID=1069815 RepID=A0ABD3X2I9_SINWO